MKQYKVLSGEYEINVTENSIEGAAGLAIRLHDFKKETKRLGIFTYIESLENSDDNGYLSTENLINEHSKNKFNR